MDLIALLNTAGVPCGPICGIDKVFAYLQAEHLGKDQSVTHPSHEAIEVESQPFTLSRTPTRPRTPIPGRGTDTEPALSDFGLNPKKINGLREQAII
ncbi:MAG: CoA transferase [bacterium]